MAGQVSGTYRTRSCWSTHWFSPREVHLPGRAPWEAFPWRCASTRSIRRALRGSLDGMRQGLPEGICDELQWVKDFVRKFIYGIVDHLTLVHLDPLEKELKRLVWTRNNKLLQEVFKELVDLILVEVVFDRPCVVELCHFVHVDSVWILTSKTVTFCVCLILY